MTETTTKIQSAVELYKIHKWGMGYFTANEQGNLCVCPYRDAPYKVDLKLLVDELAKRKVNTPILIRFMNILQDRIARLTNCFREAIEKNEYQGAYYPIFPIKVNQERDVVTSILKYGQEFGVGLEAGSKAELLIVLALTQDPSSLIVCNGYKDKEFVELVGMAHKMGKSIFPVIENYGEIETFIDHYKRTGIMPKLGVRIKLSTRGEGKWAKTGGDASKFGLRVAEVMMLVRRLAEEGLLDALKLLHFHIGSQVTKIRVVKQATVETMRVFTELWKLGVHLEYIDIGGGLGVDYDGTSADTGSTINYSLYEYANDVVYRIKQLCDENKIPHPTIISESGRFLAAHYSMLITDVPAMSSIPDEKPDYSSLPDGFGPIHEMVEIQDSITDANVMECYHDAMQYRQEALSLFNLGYLSLPGRAAMEQLFWKIMRDIIDRAKRLGLQSAELDDLDTQLVDTYYANFSLFQSLPDSWAINQIFPVIPIHRLQETPNRKAMIADLTCDSDGLVSSYIGDGGINSYVPMHQLKSGEQYYIAICLIGAYQETLGELHNLFGDTHAVQIELMGENQYRIRNLIKGDTIHQVIGFVSYSSRELIGHMREQIEAAVERGKITLDETAAMMHQYEEGLHGYTYFEDE